MNSRELIEKYHNAWTAGDFATARACLADDLDFQGSIDTFRSADEFIAALRMFQGMLRGVTMLNGFFDQDGAALLYDCDTPTPAGVIRKRDPAGLRCVGTAQDDGGAGPAALTARPAAFPPAAGSRPRSPPRSGLQKSGLTIRTLMRTIRPSPRGDR